MKQYTDAIKRYARIGLWGAVGVTLLTVLFIYLSPYRFYPSSYTARWMLIAGSVLAVLAVSMTLLTVRRRIPQMRQTEALGDKLAAYAAHIRSLYLTMLVVVVLLCVFTVLSARNVLLMLTLVTVLVLILDYPNIYRVKVDLGLDDDQMRSLYGDQYIGGDEQ